LSGHNSTSKRVLNLLETG